jgi:hypothetical protein
VSGKVNISYRYQSLRHEKKFEAIKLKLSKECINLCKIGFGKSFDCFFFYHYEIIADLKQEQQYFILILSILKIQILRLRLFSQGNVQNILELYI